LPDAEEWNPMNFDLRTPMGAIFTLIGLLLTAYGAVTNGKPAVYISSLGINANLWWGPVLAAFGVAMLVAGRRGQKRLENTHGALVKERKVHRQA
jgi:hypothetical protein